MFKAKTEPFKSLDTKHVYISGPMRHKPQQYYDMFYIAEDKLRGLGYKNVKNPAVHGKLDNDFDNQAYYDILGRAIAMLFECNTIVMLPEWESSNGARTELGIAKALNFEIIYWQDIK